MTEEIGNTGTPTHGVNEGPSQDGEGTPMQSGRVYVQHSVRAGATPENVQAGLKAAIAGKKGPELGDAIKAFWAAQNTAPGYGSELPAEGNQGPQEGPQDNAYKYVPGDGSTFEDAINKDPDFAAKVKAADNHLDTEFEGAIRAADLHTLDQEYAEIWKKAGKLEQAGIEVDRNPARVTTSIYGGDPERFARGVEIISEAMDRIFGEDAAEEFSAEIGRTGALFDPKFHQRAIWLATKATGRRI